jgi:hypothetical protein
METTNLEIGKIYNVHSQRKGKFQMIVNDIDNDFVHGMIITGMAKAILPENEVYAGETVSVRKSLTTFYTP